MKSRFAKWKKPKILDGKMTKWHWVVRHPRNLKMGKNVDIGAFSYLNAKHGIYIEDEVQLGSHCSVYTISTIDNKNGPIALKKNCRIGSHSVVMPGVTVGENSVIGAFSFVNKDIPPNSVAFGIPAKVVRSLDDSTN